MSPLGDLARQDDYLPDVGEPLVPSGPQFSPGLPVVNRMADILTTRPARDEASPVKYRTASPLVNITKQDIADATNAAQAFSGGGLGIKAYHSSPHDFDKFDLSKIGTGEGAQVYGHGLYFAENPAVSGRGGEYWRQFADRFDPQTPEGLALARLREADLNRTQAAKAASAEAGRFEQMARGEDLGVSPDKMSSRDLRQWQYQQANFLQRAESERAAEAMLRNKKAIVGPRTYEVDINADPAHFLDWDKPFREQPKAAQDALAENVKKLQELDTNIMMPDYMRKLEQGTLPGSSVYHGMGRPERASGVLSEAGIPGIKYLDQQSRARLEDALPPKQTSNYVVFNPGIIDILRKYGLAGAAPLGMGALAAQDNYQPQE